MKRQAHTLASAATLAGSSALLLLLLLALRNRRQRKKISKLNAPDMQQTYDELQDKQARLQAEYDDLQQRYQATRQEIDTLQDQYAELQKAYDKLRQECERLRSSDDAHPNRKSLATQTPAHAAESMSVLPGGDLPWNSSDEFLSQALRFIRDNMDNANLNIEEFAKQMNISRSMLFRKLKATTGLAPVDFVHRVRITYSIELLRGDYNFSQIAYMTGFNDPKYFTKCFKRYTGMTPSEWKEKRRQQAGNKPPKEILSHNSSYQFGNNLNEDLYL